MGIVIKISSKNNPEQVRKALEKLRKSKKKGKKTLSDFYGKLPNMFGDGLEYQKKVRNEWK
jgi:hypothetical protein